MNKKILWTAVIIIILITAFLTYKKLAQPAPVLAPAENQQNVTTNPADNSAKNSDAILFKCDGDKRFGVKFILPNQAQITLDTNEEILLTQSTSSPHLYESGQNSFYVEGDESNLQLSGEKYDNCAVTNS